MAERPVEASRLPLVDRRAILSHTRLWGCPPKEVTVPPILPSGARAAAAFAA